MSLEEIKKRIDESIQLTHLRLAPNRIYTEEIVGIVTEARKALEMYKGFIVEMERVNNPVYNWKLIIQELEDRYYPRTKSIRERIGEILVQYEVPCVNNEEIRKSLMKLRDDLFNLPE